MLTTHCSVHSLVNTKRVRADLEGMKPVLQAGGGRARGDTPPLSWVPIGQPQVAERGGRGGLNQTGGTGERQDVSICSGLSKLYVSTRVLANRTLIIHANASRVVFAHLRYPFPLQCFFPEGNGRPSGPWSNFLFIWWEEEKHWETVTEFTGSGARNTFNLLKYRKWYPRETSSHVCVFPAIKALMNRCCRSSRTSL